MRFYHIVSDIAILYYFQRLWTNLWMVEFVMSGPPLWNVKQCGHRWFSINWTVIIISKILRQTPIRILFTVRSILCGVIISVCCSVPPWKGTNWLPVNKWFVGDVYAKLCLGTVKPLHVKSVYQRTRYVLVFSLSTENIFISIAVSVFTIFIVIDIFLVVSQIKVSIFLYEATEGL